MKRICFLIVLFSIGALFAEDLPEKSEKMTDERFVQIYADHYYLTKEYLSLPDSLPVKQDSLFQANEITKEEFIGYLKKYEDNSEKYVQIWMKIEAEIKARKKNEDQVKKKD